MIICGELWRKVGVTGTSKDTKMDVGWMNTVKRKKGVRLPRVIVG